MSVELWNIIRTATCGLCVFIAIPLFSSVLEKRRAHLVRLASCFVFDCLIVAAICLLDRLSLPTGVVQSVAVALFFIFGIAMSFVLYYGGANTKLLFSNVTFCSLYLSVQLGNLIVCVAEGIGLLPPRSVIAVLIWLFIQVFTVALAFLLYRKLFSTFTEWYADIYNGIMCIVFGFAVVGLSFFDAFIMSMSISYHVLFVGCECFFGAVMIFLMYGIMKQNETDFQLSVLKQLWAKDRKQYELQKETIDIINIKCHDMKHQIRALKNSRMNEQALAEVEQLVDVFESRVKTGNEVLDVILSDMFLRCHEKGITLTAMADGKCLASMEEMDVYSLFYNMLENAFEYTQKIADVDKRFISVSVRRKNGGVCIHEENWFEGSISFRDGVAGTTKEDKSAHGFGMKSMQRIVAKYSGTFNAYLEDDMFQVDVFLPCDENGALSVCESVK